MTTKITPRQGLVVIKPIKQKEQKTSTGLYIPQAPGTSFEFAEVVAVGRGLLLDVGGHGGTDDLKAGQIVLIKSGAQGHEVGQRSQSFVTLKSDDGESLYLINHQDVLAIIDRSALVETDGMKFPARNN